MVKNDILKFYSFVNDFEHFFETADGKYNIRSNAKWLNPLYAVTQTFSQEEIKSITEEECVRLVQIAREVAEALYQ